MKLSKAFAAAALGLVAAMSLTGCGPANDAAMDNGATTVSNNTVASYSLPDSSVYEYSPVNAPDKICVYVDGYQSVAQDCFDKPANFNAAAQGTIHARYSLGDGKVTEFTPASDQGKLCTYVDGYKAGALSCVVKPAAPN